MGPVVFAHVVGTGRDLEAERGWSASGKPTGRGPGRGHRVVSLALAGILAATGVTVWL